MMMALATITSFNSSFATPLPSPSFLQGYQPAHCWLKPYSPSSTVRASDPLPSYGVPPIPSCITRPLVEILRDLNKRVPDKLLKTKLDKGVPLKYIPWYHANRMLSFYAPGWCGEVRSIAYSGDGKSVTVVYRVTLRGSDGEVYQESSGTALLNNNRFGDPVQEAEAIAFQGSCVRFGLGMYLYHEDLFICMTGEEVHHYSKVARTADSPEGQNN